MAKAMTVPADLRKRLGDAAADMAVPVAWVLRAAIEVALARDLDEHEMVLAVERIRDDPRRVVGTIRIGSVADAIRRRDAGETVQVGDYLVDPVTALSYRGER